MRSALNKVKDIIMTRHSSIAVAAVLAALAAGCNSQAPAPCQIQSAANGGYGVHLVRVGSAAAGCDATTPADIGDLWIFDAYGASGAVPQLIGYSATLSPDLFGGDPISPTSTQLARGKFDSVDPKSDGTCNVPSMTMSNGTASYAITNMQWLSTSAYLGTEFQADVAYTSGTCTATYKAQGITPPHACETNDDCDPFAQPLSSGINPLYDQSCNTAAWTAGATQGDPGICFFNQPFPSLGGFKK